MLGASFTVHAANGNEPGFVSIFAAGLALRMKMHDVIPSVIAGSFQTLLVQMKVVLANAEEVVTRCGGGIGDCAGGPFADYTTYSYSVCWTPASCRFFARDSLGDGWHGGTYRIRTLDGSFDIESAPPAGYKGEYVDLP